MKTLLLTIAILLLTAFIGCKENPIDVPVSTGTILVQVIDMNGNPAPNVRIITTPYTGLIFTNLDGTYSITANAPNEYLVTIVTYNDISKVCTAVVADKQTTFVKFQLPK